MSTSNLQRAARAIERGAFAEAKAICADAIARNPRDGEALFLLGNALAQSGDLEGARSVLERANAAAPGNVVVLNCLGGVYGALGRQEESIKMLETALAIDRRFPWARQNLALAYKAIGDLETARRNFEQALQVHPDLPDALAGLAEIMLTYGQIETAVQLANRAVALAPRHLPALMVQADGVRQQGKLQESLALLDRMPKAQIDAMTTARVLTMRARIHQQLKRYDEAFELFSAANQALYELHRPKFENAGGLLSLATVEGIWRFLLQRDPAAWPSQDHDGRTPTFLLGFPRSGTTLLHQILWAHPDVEALEESQNFADSLGPLVLAKGALERWGTLTESELDMYRGAYWRRVEAKLGGTPDRRVFLDKLPLNTVLLPLIHLLFPRARIIFAVRDPRDVVLSCFTTQFHMNVAMFQFLKLETAARYYDAVMRLAETARSRLPLDLHIVHYEKIVENFDDAVPDLLQFLGLAWDDRIRSYRELAGRRLIKTPSGEQVRKPLYKSSVDRWRSYEKGLAAALPLLEPWMRKFGYE